jgi:predicted nucleic acid-binding protein
MNFSQSLVRDLFNKDKLLLSPLSLQELIFTLFKLNIDIVSIEKTYSFYNEFCQYEINREILDSSFKIASNINFGKNINDIIHLKFAEKYCNKFITFDRDFKRLKQFSEIEIDIIDSS